MRTRITFAALICVLALGTTLLAQTDTTTSPSQTPQTQAPPPSPGQSGTAQSPSSASPSTMPPSGQAGAAQSQTGNSGATPQHSDPVADQLGLTQDQRTKLQPIIDDEVKQITAVRDDNSLTLQQKQQKVQQIREAGFPRIQAILTPEQRQKLAQMQQEHARQQQQQAAPAGSTTQPPPQR